MSERALITGVTGQDGAYLAKELLQYGYEVFGSVRSETSSLNNLIRLGIDDRVRLVKLDIGRPEQFPGVLDEVRPDVMFNLAAISSLGRSEANRELTFQTNATGPISLFQTAIETNGGVRLFQASSALVIAPNAAPPLDELSPRQADTFYGQAKHTVDQVLKAYRANGIHASNAILFNHESPLRQRHFVSQKIVSGLFDLANGSEAPIELGLFSDQRDWSHASDFAVAMRLVTEADTGDEYVFSSDKLHTVRDWICLAGHALGFDVVVSGEGVSETAVCRRTGQILAKVSSEFVRERAEHVRLGNSQKLRRITGWKPAYSFERLVEDMVRAKIDGN